MTLKQAIARNRRKQARFKRAERVLRQVRLKVFDYEDEGKLDKAHRVIATCKRILAPLWEARRKAIEDRQLQRTPSVYEPGICGRLPEQNS